MTRSFGIAAFLAATVLPAASAVAQAEPEVVDITIGLPITTSTFLPIYAAEEQGFFEAEGLNVEIVAFKGGTDLVRGMIAGAVDVGVTSLAGVNVGIAVDQPIKAFYGGFNMAVFDWYATSEIDSFEAAKGKRWGVSRYGSSTDFLTRYALQEEGLDPEVDVQIVQGGGSAARLAAMEAGQLDVNVFAPPHNFMAEDAGYNMILSQEDLAPDYPFHVFFATEDFLGSNPEAIKALLSGFVDGVRFVKEDREAALGILVDRVGLEEEYAGRAYDDFIDNIYEDGRMPSEQGMEHFWSVGILAGEYEEPWEEGRYLDRTYIDSFDEWAPK